jgi:hypothetical protein
MVKPLSEQLAEVSARAKKAEDNIAAAKKETQEKIIARREQIRASAAAAVDKVDKDIKSAGDAAAGQWNALKSKVASDIERLKTNRAERQYERDVSRAQTRSDRMALNAEIAIDVAIASIDDAQLAVIDAVIADLDARAA